ncbi:TRAP transporter substrate-binding protein [Hominifimenecus sp. rT4P-3]|uniref:TRAP transporter substrate-binding protein n=1 Tax=Hominifimenecus sp. rT4P-3 TaxID=3242979 RepID=UPI003DA67936
MLKKVLSIFLAIAMTGAMAACGSGESTEKTTAPAEATTAAAGGSETEAAGGENAPASDETYTIIFSHENAESSLVHKLTLQFKEEVEAATDGHVIIDIYPNSQLGSKTDNWQGLRDNTIQMVLGMGSHMDDRMSILAMPCLYSSVEACKKAMSPGSEIYDKIVEISDEIGMKLLLEVPIGFRTLSTNVETKNYDDFAGQNIRVMEMEQYIRLWSAFGFNPTPVAFSELYLALQQGLVDAQENPLDVILTNKLYEQQKYIVNTNHEPFFYGLAMNNAAWDSLPEQYQNAILEVVEHIREVAYENGIESEQAALDQMTAAGVTYVELTDEDYEKMREACKGSVYELFREYCGDELVDLAISTAEELEAK